MPPTMIWLVLSFIYLYQNKCSTDRECVGCVCICAFMCVCVLHREGSRVLSTVYITQSSKLKEWTKYWKLTVYTLQYCMLCSFKILPNGQRLFNVTFLYQNKLSVLWSPWEFSICLRYGTLRNAYSASSIFYLLTVLWTSQLCHSAMSKELSQITVYNGDQLCAEGWPWGEVCGCYCMLS